MFFLVGRLILVIVFIQLTEIPTILILFQSRMLILVTVLVLVYDNVLFTFESVVRFQISQQFM